MESVQGIRVELAGSERRLGETLGHSREITRLLGLVELELGTREEQLKDLGEKLSHASGSLERTKSDLMDTMGESRRRKEELEVLDGRLRAEKADCSALQARMNTANSSLALLQKDLGDSRGTAKQRKEELETMSLQVLREKGQVSSLKYEVDSRKQTAAELEARVGQLERRHWEAVSKSETVKKDLEQRHGKQVMENETLKKTVDNLEWKARNSDAEKLLKSKEVLEGVYRSLQRQFQAKEDELNKAEREREEYRQRLVLFDASFEPSTVDKTFGLRGKGNRLD